MIFKHTIFKRTILQQLTKKNWLVLFGIVVLALIMRLVPGKDRWLWIYDQARDAYQIRSIISQKNVVIIGPQTDYPGLNHGPASYYFLAPFYHLSQGDPNLPGLAMILLNVSTLIPLALLTQALFKNKRLTALTLFLFAISYEAIEYGRWIFNFSLSIPALAWAFYFLWQALQEKSNQKRNVLLAGLSLGIAIQGEFYLLYLVPFFGGWLFSHKQKLANYLYGLLGLVLGVSPMIIAEIKFKFLGIKTFFGEFIMGHTEAISASESFLSYIDHLSATVKHTIFGLSYPMALVGFLGLMIYVQVSFKNLKNHIQSALILVLVWLFSHSILFTFHFPDKVFLDLPVHLPLLMLTAWFLVHLWEHKQRIVSGIIFTLIIIFSLLNLTNNLRSKTAFDGYNFIQKGMFFDQKLELVNELYRLADGEEFSITVLGTPYGVQTVWASVFEQYQRRHPDAKTPTWYGDQALGYHADQFFQKVDAPAAKHIFIIEPNQTLISEYIRQQVLAKQNQTTKLVTEIELYEYRLQLRQSYELVLE